MQLLQSDNVYIAWRLIEDGPELLQAFLRTSTLRTNVTLYETKHGALSLQMLRGFGARTAVTDIIDANMRERGVRCDASRKLAL